MYIQIPRSAKGRKSGGRTLTSLISPYPPPPLQTRSRKASWNGIRNQCPSRHIFGFCLLFKGFDGSNAVLELADFVEEAVGAVCAVVVVVVVVERAGKCLGNGETASCVWCGGIMNSGARGIRECGERVGVGFLIRVAMVMVIK